jgi:two-component system sensor histidine kinase CssS
MVFITSVQKSSLVPLSYIIDFLITLIISFIVIKIITDKIVKPIQALELFAENIAHHHWDVDLTTSDTTEIQQLSESLDRMRIALKTTDEREQQFLQSSSHNLKTPVMIIKGYAQAMIDGMQVDASISPAQVIKTEAENLERRISQLLKLNTYEHTLDIVQNQDSIRIDRLLNSLVRRFEIVRPDISWSVNVKQIEINGNGEALLTAFENIIENQLRYAKSLIEINTKEDSNDTIDIIISNDGPHFNLEDPMSLFDRYKKDKAGQWGLGLAIVKQIIDSHKGKVFAQNTNTGVEFIMTLPR